VASLTPADRVVRRVLGVAVAVAVALTGCSTASVDGEGGPPAEPAATGALVVRTEAGSKAAYAPSHSPYFYTQGFLICREGGSSEVAPVLRSVSFNTRLKPLEVQPVIRRIPEEADRDGPPGGWSPILDALGKPGAFEDTPVRGDFSYDFDGTRVTESCADASESWSAKMELEIVMNVPKEGADIDGFTISYDIGDKSHEVHVPWRMVGCGTETDREMCGLG